MPGPCSISCYASSPPSSCCLVKVSLASCAQSVASPLKHGICHAFAGEALDIDLSDFINRLYAMLPSLAIMADIETTPPTSFKSSSAAASPRPQTVSDMLFRALHLVFTRRTATGASPHWRSAAFAKRLLTASLQWPPSTATRAIAFVGDLVERDPKLEALLSTDDRSVNGVYRPDLDDPQLCNPFGTNFWELHVLAQRHWDKQVAQAARKLMGFSTS